MLSAAANMIILLEGQRDLAGATRANNAQIALGSRIRSARSSLRHFDITPRRCWSARYNQRDCGNCFAFIFRQRILPPVDKRHRPDNRVVNR